MPIDPRIVLSGNPVVPVDPMAAYERASRFQAQQQAHQQQIELGGLRLDAEREDAAGRKSLREAQQAAQHIISQLNGGTGQEMIDRFKAQNPQAGEMVQQYFDKEQARTTAARKERAQFAQAMGYEATIVATVFGLDPNPAAMKAYEAAKNDPAKIKAIIDHYAGQAPETPKLTEHDPKKSLIDPTGKVITPPEGEPPKPEKITFGPPVPAMVNNKRQFVRAGSDGRYYGTNGQRLDGDVEPISEAPKTPEKERLVQIMGASGTPIWVRESQAEGKPAAQAARAVTGQERQSLAFYNRAKEAVDTLTQDGAGGSLEQRVANSGLARQGQLQYAPNVLQSDDQQAYRQAQRAFTEARLRKESGAAIPNAEYENDAKTYFAQPGDGPKLIEQKRKARNTVLAGLKFGAGKAYDEFYGKGANDDDGAPADLVYDPATKTFKKPGAP